MYATEMENDTLPLDEMLDGVNEEFYGEMNQLIDDLGKQSQFTEDEYVSIRFIIANHMYLIHEYLNLGKSREIDYKEIREFAIENKELVRYLFRKYFRDYSVEVFDSWMDRSVDILECAMYRPSTRYNKHTFH